jgi:transcriptional regulator NrdR family protein
MNCPKCSARLRCVDTRTRGDGLTRRRQRCDAGCGTFTTLESFIDADNRTVLALAEQMEVMKALLQKLIGTK